MNKEKWESMTDEQKTSYMRKVFKDINIGDCFDYAECRRVYNKMTEVGIGTHGVYQNPCIVLELFDPVMAPTLMSWMYRDFDDSGDAVGNNQGSPAPLFGYNMIELTFDKGTLMEFSDSEKQILREAMRIIGKKTKQEGDLPIGVQHYANGRYKVLLQYHGYPKYLGIFNTIQEAFSVYKIEKEKYIKELADEYFLQGKITQKVYDAMNKYEVEIND